VIEIAACWGERPTFNVQRSTSNEAAAL
jgi:hypothetical protein